MKELLARVDSREMTEWIAYSEIEPWGEGPAWLRHGIAMALHANVNRDPKKRSQPYEPFDFIPGDPDGADEAPQATEEDRVKHMVRMLNATLAVDNRDLTKIPRWALTPKERADLDRKGQAPTVVLTDVK